MTGSGPYRGAAYAALSQPGGREALARIRARSARGWTIYLTPRHVRAMARELDVWTARLGLGEAAARRIALADGRRRASTVSVRGPGVRLSIAEGRAVREATEGPAR